MRALRDHPAPEPGARAIIRDIATLIAAGGVVAVPTDTVYGLACDPANASAVERIYDIKRRPAGLELTLLAAAANDLRGLAELDGIADILCRRFWPGPLSIVVPIGQRRTAVPRRGTSVSCRVPAHELLIELLLATGPLASTSANRHGEPAAVTAAEARAALGDDVDAILDGGPAAGIASTIIDCTTTPPRVLREGPIAAAELLAQLTAAQHPRRDTMTRSEEKSEGQ